MTRRTVIIDEALEHTFNMDMLQRAMRDVALSLENDAIIATPNLKFVVEHTAPILNLKGVEAVEEKPLKYKIEKGAYILL